MATTSETPLALSTAPELVFGLVAPIGVDLDIVTDLLEQTLREMEYEARPLRLTQLMREIPIDLPLGDTHYIGSFKERIAYANEVRRQLGDEALAALAVSAIRTFRSEERARRRTEAGGQPPKPGPEDEEAPIAGQAYIIRQIKRPEEVGASPRRIRSAIYPRCSLCSTGVAYSPHC
jgi:cytidine deaminase